MVGSNAESYYKRKRVMETTTVTTTKMSVREKSLSYGVFFCSRLGDRACDLITKLVFNIPTHDKLHINVFNSNTGCVEKYYFVEVMTYLFNTFKINPTANNNAQVCVGDNLYLSVNIYNFLYDHWMSINDKFSEGLYYNSLTGEYTESFTLSPNAYLDGFFAPVVVA